MGDLFAYVEKLVIVNCDGVWVVQQICATFAHLHKLKMTKISTTLTILSHLACTNKKFMSPHNLNTKLNLSAFYNTDQKQIAMSAMCNVPPQPTMPR
jgi:hypothetical protein